MREKIISFFLKRHLLTNLLFVVVFIGGIAAEYYVTKPLEEEIR